MTYSSLFNDTATTDIYTLSLHDALPIFGEQTAKIERAKEMITEVERDQRAIESEAERRATDTGRMPRYARNARSEEHTSELQSRFDLVCRLLLEKKKNSGQIVTSKVDIT